MSLGVLCVAGTAIQAAQENGSSVLVPQPKQFKLGEGVVTLGTNGQAAIVLGQRAASMDQYAAQRLQGHLEQRFGRRLTIAREDQGVAQLTQVILIGRRDTNSWLDRLCTEHKIDLGPTSPGHDGYLIEMLNDQGRQVTLIAGSDERGVIYGQDTFLQLITRQGNSLQFPAVSVRDWPSIPWRGRPISRYERNLMPGVLDAYMDARMNFIDLRDGPEPRRGQFGIPPDFAVKTEEFKRLVAEAHRRGLFVYATVFCGVKPDQFDAVIGKFQELINLGADGLWASFDDPGPGERAPELVRRVIELGKQHGMTGRKIAIVPPTGSYQNIDTPFNREMAKVPGMEEATWFFTRPPSAEDVKACRAIGIQALPAWWHNWPRTTGGFTHLSYGGSSLRTGGRSPYLDIPPLSAGWHNPTYEQLRDGARNCSTVMLWGGWPEEYVCPVLGFWAWDPERHDWEATRRAIAERVFGPAAAEEVISFDESLAALKNLCTLPERSADPTRWPPRLRDTSAQSKALALLDEMAQSLAAIRADTSTSLIAPERLESLFLEPMTATVEVAKASVSLARPEDWWPEHEAKVLALADGGKGQDAATAIADGAERLEEQLSALRRDIGRLVNIEEYLKLWEARQRWTLAEFQTFAREREKRISERIGQLVAAGLSLSNLFGPARQPPEGGKLVAQLHPAEIGRGEVRVQGPWMGGLFVQGDYQAVAFSFPSKTASKPGDFAEISFTLHVPAFEGKLILQAFINDDKVTDQWTEYRFLQLLQGDKVLWEEDIALPRTGKEWAEIDVSGIAKPGEDLRLTFRILDRRGVGNYATAVFLGPVRLVQK